MLSRIYALSDEEFQTWKTRFEMRYLIAGIVAVAAMVLLGYARVI